MKQRMKGLGLALVAMLALSAASASAVHAKGMFGAESYPVSVKGSATGVSTFKIGAGTTEIVCSSQALNATTLTKASATLTLTPEFANCTYNPGGMPVTIDADGCAYALAIGDFTAPGTGTGSETISCPPGEELDIFLYGSKAQQEAGQTTCVWGVPGQGPLGTIGYAAKGSGSTASIDLDTSATVKANVIKGPAVLCGASAGGSINLAASADLNLTAEYAGVPSGLGFTGGGVYMAGEASGEPSKQPRIESEWGAEAISVAGSQDAASPHLFKVGNGVREVNCSAIQLAGELAGPSKELPLSATYTGCTAAPGNLPATVSMNSCEYELNVLNAGPPYGGSLDVGCAGGDGIDIKINNKNGTLLCHYKVASQSGLTGIGLSTVGSDIHRGVGLSLGLSGIAYTLQSGTAIACGAKVGVPATNLSYSGGTTLLAS